MRPPPAKSTPLSLHDALPICNVGNIGQQISADLTGDLAHPLEINNPGISARAHRDHLWLMLARHIGKLIVINALVVFAHRSEEHTSELQSRLHLVCRLLLEKK